MRGGKAQQATARVASSMALDMQAKANAHVRLAPVVAEAVILVKQKGIIGRMTHHTTAFYSIQVKV
jgi:hypothetical protein